MNIKPLGSKVVLSVQLTEEKTAGGLFIPQKKKKKTQIGTVKAVGPGTEKVKMEVKPGDKILFDKYAGTSVKVGEDEFLIIDAKDILAGLE